jgi:5'-nucleotidase
MQLTGAQIKGVLEQQWQPAGSSRPFLKLGTSKGFTYTYDPTAEAGSRITAMWLNGEAIDPANSYSVTANSFLAAGGDNFTVFGQGTEKRDTGKIDLQAMVDYMAEFASSTPVAADPKQRAVGIDFAEGAPASYLPGGEVAFKLSSLAYSTAADAKDSEVKVSLGDQELGTFPVDNTIGTAVFDEYGTADVKVILPADTPVGEAVLTVTGVTTGTSVPVTVSVNKADSVTTATASPATVRVKKDSSTIQVSVTASGATPTGTVEAYLGGERLAKAVLVNGKAILEVEPFNTVGTKEIDVRYLGDSQVAASSDTATVVVVKSTAKEQ